MDELQIVLGERRQTQKDKFLLFVDYRDRHDEKRKLDQRTQRLKLIEGRFERAGQISWPTPSRSGKNCAQLLPLETKQDSF